jgi:hypothetical protein
MTFLCLTYSQSQETELKLYHGSGSSQRFWAPCGAGSGPLTKDWIITGEDTFVDTGRSYNSPHTPGDIGYCQLGNRERITKKRN